MTKRIQFLGAIFILILLVGCNASRQFKKVQQANSIEAYQQFINDHPKSKHINQAETSLHSLKEKRDWDEACKKNTVWIFEKFLNNYPNTSYRDQAEKRIHALKVKNAWREAVRIDKTYAYENFLHSFPNTTYSFKAKNRIAELKDQAAWEEARTVHTVDAYQQYLDSVPNASKRIEALEFIKEIEVVFPEWQETLEVGTPQAYRNFLVSYPKSSYSDNARLKLKLMEAGSWVKAKSGSDVKLIETYLSDFPNGKYVEDAKQLVYKIEVLDPAWKNAQKSNTPSSYRTFIAKYPNSEYALDANENLKRLEREYWAQAVSSKNKWKYKKYLNNFPNGDHVEEAEKAIIDIEVEEIFAGEHGKLPPMTRAMNSGFYTSKNEVEVYNKTKYNLTVRYSGSLESKKVVLGPREKKKFSLKNGEYKVAASVDAAHVMDFAGKENLVGGTYTATFYIVTR